MNSIKIAVLAGKLSVTRYISEIVGAKTKITIFATDSTKSIKLFMIVGFELICG
jgi:hypothetical protein